MEFFKRLEQKLPAASFEEARDLMETTLNEVEDELTGIPNRPENWMTDGRLYPPMDDNLYEVPGKPSVKRFRTKGHNIFISKTGAIHIEKFRDGKVVFQHPDAHGKGVDR